MPFEKERVCFLAVVVFLCSSQLHGYMLLPGILSISCLAIPYVKDKTQNNLKIQIQISQSSAENTMFILIYIKHMHNKRMILVLFMTFHHRH